MSIEDTYFVYHICRMQDIGNLREGYIGITKNPFKRWRKSSYKDNPHLQSALNKYNDIVKYVIYSDTKEFCLFLEEELRPRSKIGWNCVRGGGIPPSVMERQIVPENNYPFEPKFGKDNFKFEGYWVTPFKIFETRREASIFYKLCMETITRRCKTHSDFKIRKAGGVIKNLQTNTWKEKGWYFIPKEEYERSKMKTLEFIKEKGIKALTSELGIAVKEFYTENNELLYLLDYSQIDSPKLDDVVKECRSLILDSEFNVVSRSMDRFFNLGEADGHIPEINWKEDVVAEKIDGSLIKIYSYKDIWRISTRGTAFADSKVGSWDLTFKDLVFKALRVTNEEEFQTRCNKFLQPIRTYIFEVTAMENRIVTKYEDYFLHLLGIRDNILGTYVNNEILHSEFGHKKVKTYSFATKEDCVEAANNLPDLKEGYVVYKQGVPICKIKSPLYVSIHYVKGNGLTPRIIMEKVLANEVEEYLAYFPEDSKHFLPYQKCYIQMMIDILKAYNEHMLIEDQKEFAMSVKDFPFAAILFHARKMKIGVSESFEQQTDPYKMRLLESYVKVEKE